MAIVECQLAARRRIQGRDTGAYMPAQKGPTIIVLIMCIFRLSESLTVSTGNSEDYFRVRWMPRNLREKMHLHAAQHVYNTWEALFPLLYHIGFGQTLPIGFVSKYIINLTAHADAQYRQKLCSSMIGGILSKTHGTSRKVPGFK